jgi:hypothetical protein
VTAPAWASAVQPTLSGAFGRAWRWERFTGRTPDQAATLALWVLNCPGAHPFWSWWVVSVIHLREISGVRPATITRPGATHELIVGALNPDKPVPDPRDTDPRVQFLTPIDVIEQFEVRSDVEAALICELGVRCCCAGELSPDQDFRSLWSRRIQATAEDMRNGCHPDVQA